MIGEIRVSVESARHETVPTHFGEGKEEDPVIDAFVIHRNVKSLAGKGPRVTKTPCSERRIRAGP